MADLKILRRAGASDQIILVGAGSPLERTAVGFGKKTGASVASVRLDEVGRCEKQVSLKNILQSDGKSVDFEMPLGESFVARIKGSVTPRISPYDGRTYYSFNRLPITLEAVVGKVTPARVVLDSAEFQSDTMYKINSKNTLFSVDYYGGHIDVSLNPELKNGSFQVLMELVRRYGDNLKSIMLLEPKERFPFIDFFPLFADPDIFLKGFPEQGYAIGRLPFSTDQDFEGLLASQRSWEERKDKNACLVIVEENPKRLDDPAIYDGFGNPITMFKGMDIHTITTKEELIPYLLQYDIVCIHAHGNEEGLYFRDRRVGKQRFHPYDIPKLPHHPLIIAEACDAYAALGEGFIRQGAIGFVGKSLEYYAPSTRYYLQDFDTLGELVALVNNDTVGGGIPFQILGNPALRLQ